MIQYNFPTIIYFGTDALSALGQQLAVKQHQRLLIVTDAGLVSIGLIEQIQQQIQSFDLETVVFDGVHPNPTEADVEAGVDFYQNGGFDGLIGIGGGSAIDVAKTIRLMAVHPAPLSQYEEAKGGTDLICNPLPPCYAIPTTAGTGSEVGRSSVITLTGSQQKSIFFHPTLIPDIAVLDPTLTTSLPAHLTAATGADAFSHSFETYLVRLQHPMADGIALEGMKMVAQYLPTAVAQGTDLEARGQMLLAATMGATAFQKGLGVIHSMAHPLSTLFDMHHGLANALLLVEGTRFTLERTVETDDTLLLAKLQTVADIFSPQTPVEVTELPQLITDFLRQIGIQSGLYHHGISSESIPALTRLAYQDPCHQNHPFPVTEPEIEAIYHRALGK